MYVLQDQSPPNLISGPKLEQCKNYFDYSFLNASFDRFGLGHIGNPKLCTIELARRTFESERYGLAYLIDFLEIETATHHRAFSDAVCAAKVMEKSLETLPEYVKSADELLRFSVSSKKERRLKKEEKQRFTVIFYVIPVCPERREEMPLGCKYEGQIYFFSPKI